MEQMTPEDAKASLGLATRLSEQHLMSMNPQMPSEAPQETQNVPQQEMEQKPQQEAENTRLTEMEGKMTQGFEDLRNELHATIKSEIGGIRDEIKSAIEDGQD